MKSTFKSSLMSLGAMVLLSAFLFAMIVVIPESILLYDIALGGVVFMMCSSPLVILIAIVSGIATAISSFSGQEKKKRDFTDFGLDDDSRMDEIMSRLTAEQQIYLENKLRNSRLGISSDGELMSMDDLLDDFDSKEKRDYLP